MSRRGWEIAGYATLADMRASLVPAPCLRQAVQDPPGGAIEPPRSNSRPEAETHPWRAVARACWARAKLPPDMAARYRGCQCREPADCLLGRATVRPWVGLDTECRTCVERGGPPPRPADFP